MGLSELQNLYQNLDTGQKLTLLHSERERLTSTLLHSDSLNFRHHLHRAAISYCLGYPDLAAGDAYRALTLLETYFDPDFSDFPPEKRNEEGEVVPWPDDDQSILAARVDMTECLKCLVLALTDLGCLRDAYAYLVQLGQLDKANHFFLEEEHQRLRDSILRAQNLHRKEVHNYGDASRTEIEPARLRNIGYARREIYRWNKHEPGRSSSQAVDSLNRSLKPVAPDLEVRSVELPVLEGPSDADPIPTGAAARSSTLKPAQFDESITSVQFGLFAKVDLPESSPVLHEASVLTAVRPLDASLCHNCGSILSEPSTNPADGPDGPVCCPSCANAAVFCSQSCLNIAQIKYHGTTCGNEDIDPLGRDDNSDTPSEDLYFLLLTRAFAMSHAQNTHPLELPETKYLWGEFVSKPTSEHSGPPSLPFSFQHNIVLPFRLLSTLSEQHPDMSPFSARGLDWYDTWVVETLYAKFRGVASARQSTWDGKPEVAAVHPLWCLANHSCAPNVEWGWGRERVFRVREKPIVWDDRKDTSRVEWKGVKAGEEILSHYCDVNLHVKDRREYMLGSLGGQCMCERCVWEVKQEQSFSR
jgi:hypothetical protein